MANLPTADLRLAAWQSTMRPTSTEPQAFSTMFSLQFPLRGCGWVGVQIHVFASGVKTGPYFYCFFVDALANHFDVMGWGGVGWADVLTFM